MSVLIDETDRRRIAGETQRSLFVEAGAGSGKTRALVDRILTLVMRDGHRLSRIAAVTFTEKAGAELRGRLRSAFEEQVREARRAGAGDEHDDTFSVVAEVVPKAAISSQGFDGAAATDNLEERLRRAEQGLEDLDSAAIGTLHAFAQRILVRHGIRVGLPPEIEVSDEVASGVAFEQRWSQMRRELLDDTDMSRLVLAAMSVGVTLVHLRALARAFGNDWDLAAERVPAPSAVRVEMPDPGPLLRAVTLLEEQALGSTDPADPLVLRIAELADWGARLREAAASEDPREVYAILVGRPSTKVGRTGRAPAWKAGGGIGPVREAVVALGHLVDEAAARVTDATLRPIASWIAQRVVTASRERAAEGRLEFHDLLVLSRALLREHAQVRAALQRDFPVLMLDEFQDTDPIQVELAVRIAAGTDGGAPDWHDVRVPPGALFLVGDPKQSIYRFRRADIRVFLDVGRWFGTDAGATLRTNFRTTEPVLAWVNATFDRLISADGEAQPGYVPLEPHRPAVTTGPAVLALGARAHEDLPRAGAAVLREREARDVATALGQAMARGWTVVAPDGLGAEVERPMRWHDVAVLVPARTSLPFLEDALENAGIPFRAESSSLVYSAPEVRALMAAVRAVADPTDTFAVVTALRSPLYGCGDDDLWTWRRDEGSFSLLAPVEHERADHPVGRALIHLQDVRRSVRWAAPSEVLARLVVDRRMLEVPADAPRSAREQWRRLRFVVDQARAWSEVSHGGLRAYLAWAARQADESSRVAEAVLPETDVDAVRVMTVHAAKGLEFPVVVLSGMTSLPNRPRGVRLLWTTDGYELRLKAEVQTEQFEAEDPVDEQMDHLERRRLLYVAATRARDHLIVSLHRKANARGTPTNAMLLADEGLAAQGAVQLGVATDGAERNPSNPSTVIVRPPEHVAWQARLERARERTRHVPVISPSGLEGTDPEIALGSGRGQEAAVPRLRGDGEFDGSAAPGTGGALSAERRHNLDPDPDLDPDLDLDLDLDLDGDPDFGGDPTVRRDPDLAKGARDVELPPWAKGRHGTAVGRAVHGVLQSLDLRLGPAQEVAHLVAAQCLAEDAVGSERTVAALARAALASPMVRWAAEREHWAETFVGAPHDGRVLEGFIDLLVRDEDGGVTVVDYKTDQVPQAALGVRAGYYAPQLRAYASALRSAGVDVRRAVLLFLHPEGAVERDVDLAT